MDTTNRGFNFENSYRCVMLSGVFSSACVLFSPIFLRVCRSSDSFGARLWMSCKRGRVLFFSFFFLVSFSLSSHARPQE